MKYPLKVLAIINLNNPVSNRPDVELFIGLKKAGVEVEVMTLPGCQLTAVLESEGINVITLFPHKKIQIPFIRFTRQLLKKGGHHILHLFNSKAISNGILASIGLPVKIITYRGAKGPYWHDPTSYLTHFNPKVDSIICVSGYVRNSVALQKIVPVSKLHVVYKGTKLEWFGNITPVNYNNLLSCEDGFFVTCIANLRPVKGVDFFIRAAEYFGDFKNIHLIVIGEGTDSPGFKKRISQLSNASSIHPLGYQKDVLPYLAASNAFVLPSLSEGLSRTVIQAMALKLPIISTACGGPEEILTDGHSAIFVPVRNPKAIADAILKIYKSPDSGKRMGENAQQFLRDNLSIDVSIIKTLEVYRKVIGDD